MGRRMVAWLVALVVSLAGAGPAAAQDYFDAPDPIIFKVDRERPTRDRILIASLFGGAVVFAGVGALFHLDSKRKADEVGTDAGKHTGTIYTPALDDVRSAGVRSRNLTIASYAASAGFLIGTLIAFVATDPGHESIQVGEKSVRPRVHLAPTGDGAVVGAGWSF